ncbi:hypothetical protein RFI_13736 [Reticulomyxa filosa]|uniref:Uncharacterized protein n=1 Tax=Reticulomyxa filosa TaxID=46433 RepID=X6NBT0_RETFI|nr:hypothetical protein RFI_13736 [Reticulomyxa filosa]|eukprot:ETO23446.1 hypothetical protein RFI_13736 [Reticulomyxa filosa]
MEDIKLLKKESIHNDTRPLLKMRALYDHLRSAFAVNRTARWSDVQRYTNWFEHTSIGLWIEIFENVEYMYTNKLFKFARGCYYPQLLMYLKFLEKSYIAMGNFKIVQFEHFIDNYQQYAMNLTSWIGGFNRKPQIKSLPHRGSASVNDMSDITLQMLQHYYTDCNELLYQYLANFGTDLYFVQSSFQKWY